MCEGKILSKKKCKVINLSVRFQTFSGKRFNLLKLNFPNLSFRKSINLPHLSHLASTTKFVDKKEIQGKSFEDELLKKSFNAAFVVMSKCGYQVEFTLKYIYYLFNVFHELTYEFYRIFSIQRILRIDWTNLQKFHLITSNCCYVHYCASKNTSYA